MVLLERIKNLPRSPQPEVPGREVWLALLGTLIGIGLTSWLAFWSNYPMLLGPFGATAVLIYGAYKAPLAQPRNVLLGYFNAAAIGCVMYDFFGTTWYSLALGVALALILMMVTYSVHPPAGAVAYVAIQTGGIGGGYMYILNPTMIGGFILVLVAVIFNKLGKRDYPVHWW